MHSLIRNIRVKAIVYVQIICICIYKMVLKLLSKLLVKVGRCMGCGRVKAWRQSRQKREK